MLVGLTWLKDYVDVQLTAKDLADKLTMAGLEVDEIKKSVRPSAALWWQKSYRSARIRPQSVCLCAMCMTERTFIGSSVEPKILHREISFRWRKSAR